MGKSQLSTCVIIYRTSYYSVMIVTEAIICIVLALLLKNLLKVFMHSLFIYIVYGYGGTFLKGYSDNTFNVSSRTNSVVPIEQWQSEIGQPLYKSQNLVGPV